MAQKIQIKFDIDNKDLDIVAGKTLTLQQQIRILKQEIQKPGYAPKELDILRSKLGSIEDQLKNTRTRSGDFITTLQLIPGPIGEIASKINGAISLFKQFGSFSLDDLKFQFKETIDDIKEVAGVLGKVTGITKIYTVLNNALAQSFVKVGVGEAAATAGARAFSAALVATGVGALVVALGLAVNALMEFASSSDEAEQQQKELNDQIERTNMLLDMDLAAAARRQKIKLAELRKAGATEAQIRTQGVEDLKENLRLVNLALEENSQSERQAMSDDTANLKDVYAQRRKLEEQQKELIAGIRVAELDNETKTNEEKEQQRQKGIKDTKEANDKAAALAKEQKDRRDKELADIKAQGAAALQAERDAQQQRLDARKDFNQRVRDLYTSIIEDEGQRRREELKNQQADELKSLMELAQAAGASEEEKGRIRYAIRLKYKGLLKELMAEESKDEQNKNEKDRMELLRILELRGSTLIEGTRGFYQNRLEIINETEKVELDNLEKAYKDGELKTDEYEAKKTSIEKNAQDARKQNRQAEVASIGRTISASIDALGALTNALAGSLEEEAKTSKSAFEKRKKLQVATAVMSAASGLVQILTQPSTLLSPFDWIVKGVNAAALGIATATNIKKIKATQFEGGGDTASATPYKVTANRAAGGIVSGPGTSTSDSIPAMISNGEYVVNARATNAFLPMLNAINDYGRRPRFAMGGLVQSQSPSTILNENLTQALTETMMRPVKTYVVGQDMSSQQQFDRLIKSRSLM